MSVWRKRLEGKDERGGVSQQRNQKRQEAALARMTKNYSVDNDRAFHPSFFTVCLFGTNQLLYLLANTTAAVIPA